MSANEGKLCGDWPIVVAGVQVSVADTRAVELDETLAGCELRRLFDGVIVDDVERGVTLLDDRRLLGLGDGILRSHCGVER